MAALSVGVIPTLATLGPATVRTPNDFRPWEVDILLDIESCQLERGRKEETLRCYQQAVERQLETSPGPPMKLSEFLKLRGQRHE